MLIGLERMDMNIYEIISNKKAMFYLGEFELEYPVVNPVFGLFILIVIC